MLRKSLASCPQPIFRVELDENNDTLGYKIRKAQMGKGSLHHHHREYKEVGAGNISVRTRKGADEGSVDLESFINRVHDEVENRTVD